VGLVARIRCPVGGRNRRVFIEEDIPGGVRGRHVVDIDVHIETPDAAALVFPLAARVSAQGTGADHLDRGADTRVGMGTGGGGDVRLPALIPAPVDEAREAELEEVHAEVVGAQDHRRPELRQRGDLDVHPGPARVCGDAGIDDGYPEGGKIHSGRTGRTGRPFLTVFAVSAGGAPVSGGAVKAPAQQ
jgi:hypothetical protein